MRIAINTKDQAWAEAHGIPAADGKTIVMVPDAATERVTFAGRDMIRFDMAAATPTHRLPRDWGNRYTMYPATRIV